MTELDKIKSNQKPIDAELGLFGMNIEEMQSTLEKLRVFIDRERQNLAKAQLGHPNNHAHHKALSDIISRTEQTYRESLAAYNASIEQYKIKKSALESGGE